MFQPVDLKGNLINYTGVTPLAMRNKGPEPLEACPLAAFFGINYLRNFEGKVLGACQWS